VTAIHQENSHKVPAEKVATIFITQYPEEMLTVDRLLVMHDGKIVADDTPESVYSRVEFLKNMGLEPPIEYQLKQLFETYRP
jgi:ABC-type multidrug transport system ATPase subunit